MLRWLSVRLALAAALGALLLALPQPGGAQTKADPKKGEAKAEVKKDGSEPVNFLTVDGVKIVGNYYPGDARAPVVLMLHAVVGADGKPGNSDEAGWSELATRLNKELKFAVLRFDFRGHGKSIDVERNTFWKDIQNQKSVRGFVAGNLDKCRERISYRDFSQTNYYLRLLDDIAAAKAYLDRRNDAGECNSSNVYLLGAEDGAALGALWAVTEFGRYKARQEPSLIPTLPPRLSKILNSVPEGRSVSAALWLSLAPSVKSTQIPSDIIRELGKTNKVPMAFVYGKKHSAAENYANRCKELVVGAGKGELTGTRGIDETALAGSKLLALKKPDALDFIVKYFGQVKDERGKVEWEKKEVEKNAYIWETRSGALFPAKFEGERTLLPIPAERFLR